MIFLARAQTVTTAPTLHLSSPFTEARTVAVTFVQPEIPLLPVASFP